MATLLQQQGLEDITEAYKSIIEFNKVIISLASLVLAALISYIVSQDFPLTFRNLASPVALIVSLIFSLSGFGRAIPAIQKQAPRKMAVRLSNIGGYIMLLGISLIFVITKDGEKRIDSILREVNKLSSILKYKLQPQNCSSFELKDSTYILNYTYDSITVRVEYSLNKDRILSLSTTVIPNTYNVDDRVRLRNITFAFNKWTLEMKAFPELELVAGMLQQHPSMTIEIGAHTDSKGSEQFNQLLSEQRAAEVVRFIVSRGIPQSRISYKGYGEIYPVASNDSEQGREINRRVEFKIISN